NGRWIIQGKPKSRNSYSNSNKGALDRSYARFGRRKIGLSLKKPLFAQSTHTVSLPVDSVNCLSANCNPFRSEFICRDKALVDESQSHLARVSLGYPSIELE